MVGGSTGRPVRAENQDRHCGNSGGHRGSSGDRHDLRMTAFHNGKQVSDGNLKDMNWTFAQILERASYGVTLRPGEVIGSGTVGTGCYMELNLTTLKDQPVWIQPGDTFTLEVEKLGRLENEIRRETP